MNTSLFNRTVCLFSLTAASAGLAGCQMPDLKESKIPGLSALDRHIPWIDEEEDTTGVPNRIVTNWVDAVHYQQGKMPQRGFGGRLFFYDARDDQPILVDGQLVVYAFKEDGRDPSDNRPTRKYVFPAEVLTQQAGETDAGKSYSIWLPWDDLGGPQTRVSLMCRFEPKLGPVVVSPQAPLILPGPGGLPGPEDIGTKPASDQPIKVPDGVPYQPAVEQAVYQPTIPASGRDVQTASYQPATNVPRQMSATTISLPDSMVRSRAAAAAPSGGSFTEPPGPFHSTEVQTARNMPAQYLAAQAAAAASAANSHVTERANSAVSPFQRNALFGMSAPNAAAAPRYGAIPIPALPQRQMLPPPMPAMGGIPAMGGWNTHPMAAQLAQQAVPTPATPQPQSQAQLPGTNPPSPSGATSAGPTPTPGVTIGQRYTMVNGQLQSP